MNIELDNNFYAVVNMGADSGTNVSMKAVMVDGGGGISIGGGSISIEGGSMDVDGGAADISSSGGGLLSSWPFVGGVTGAVFVLSVIIGIVFAKRRIKKGIDIYES